MIKAIKVDAFITKFPELVKAVSRFDTAAGI
jgi:hypothetical protein